MLYPARPSSAAPLKLSCRTSAKTTTRLDLAAEAYKNLLGSVPEMGLKKRLIVVPDSPLAGLPFEVLIAPSGKSLLQSHIVTYAPSGTVLALLRETPAADRRAVSALAVAAGGSERREGLPTQASLKVQRGIYDLDGTELPPLPAAEEEAKAVVSMVGGAFRSTQRSRSNRICIQAPATITIPNLALCRPRPNQHSISGPIGARVSH